MDYQREIISDSMIIEVEDQIPDDLDVTNILSSLTLSPARKPDSVIEFDPYEAIETFSLLCEPRLWYKCKAVRRRKIAAIVPYHLIPFYVGQNLEGGVFSLNYFQIDYHDPYYYPRLDNYSFVRNDWAILINNKTKLILTTEGENDWFSDYLRVPLIRFLLEEQTSRQMLIDVVGKLKEISLNTYLHVINAGRRGNVLESTDVTKIEFNPIMPEAQELKHYKLLCMLKNNSNITMSNSYVALGDESDEDVENVYDESANLFRTKTCENSSTFTAAAG
ncbi:hypothetical protein Tco_0755636 [Tanacetum coccineum]